jgi:hypothetical protein
MTRRISLIIGTAVAALAVGVPVASAGATPVLHVGAGSQDRSQQSDFWNYDQTGRKVADTSPGVLPGDLADLYAGPGSGAVSSDGDDVEWAQIGAGLGIGVLLGLGLIVGLGGVRYRPLPH